MKIDFARQSKATAQYPDGARDEWIEKTAEAEAEWARRVIESGGRPLTVGGRSWRGITKGGVK